MKPLSIISITFFLLSSYTKAFSSKHASRRTFLVEKVISAVAVLTPIKANSEENNSDFFKDAQARFAARNKERIAAKLPGVQDKERNAVEGDGFVFSTKVEEIQTRIAERKEEAILFDKQETNRSENNEFIKELKARSVAKKDQYRKESMRSDKLSTKQFRDNYNRPSYTAMETSDGSIKMISDSQLKELEKANQIKIGYKTSITKDGKEFTDYSRKMIMLIDEVVPSNAGEDEPPLGGSESIQMDAGGASNAGEDEPPLGGSESIQMDTGGA